MESVSIIEQCSNRMAVIDLESKLLQNNSIFITDTICSETVTTVQAELFYLTSKLTASESIKNPIKIYINSPGGDCYSALGLYDVIQYFINKGYIIQTINIGLAASAAAIILLSGSIGYRKCLPNTFVMLHQPSSGVEGTVTDMQICVEHVQEMKKIMSNIISKHSSDKLIPFLERDKWFNASESLQYNIIDQIMS